MTKTEKKELIIACDSTADFEVEDVKKLGLQIIPLTINFEDESFIDGELDKNVFFEKLASSKKLPHTSQPTPDLFTNLFEKVKENNQSLILILIGSGFSGTYQCAEMVKESVGYDDIYIIDSGLTIGSLQILIREAVEKKDTMPAKELADYLNEFKKRIRMYAIIDTLEYLKKGGRLSSLTANIGKLLNLKLVCEIDGNIKVVGKTLGLKKAFQFIADKIKKEPIDFDHYYCYGYAHKKDNMEALINYLSIPEEGHKCVIESVGAVTGTHTGPNACAIFYVAQEQK